MPKFNWDEINRNDVIKAIRIFDSDNSKYPEARSTFLIFEGRKYPAKHIRGIAYQVHFGVEISKENFSGGQETIRFFSRLGFEIQYTPSIKNTNKNTKLPAMKSQKQNNKNLSDNIKEIDDSLKVAIPSKSVSIKRNGLKIGLYLQSDELFANRNEFDKAMNVVRSSDIDVLVFPEFSFVPFDKEFRNADYLDDNDVNHLYQKALDLSHDIGRAIVVCNKDRFGTIMSIYANAFASDTETLYKDYIKHTMTEFSAFEIENYQELAEYFFEPIILKGYRIGLTICYDCNHSLFSRKYGVNGIDIILNSTGGNVDYNKWFKYNKVRAIENKCFTFSTMGYEQPNNYVYGFTLFGKKNQLFQRNFCGMGLLGTAQ